jgi:hypothetical protein
MRDDGLWAPFSQPGKQMKAIVFHNIPESYVRFPF